MTGSRFPAFFAIIVVATLAVVSRAALAEPRASADDTARVLAGLPPSAGSPLVPLTADANWKQHARSFDDAWNGLERRQLTKIRALVAKNFTNPQPLLYYMFSGPDFLYADAFFPAAQTYVMAGLEPPGPVPDLRKLSRGELSGALRDLRSSLSSVLSYSFFQTKFMRVDFSRSRMQGTLPVLMVFLARSGKTIYDVSLFDLQSDGTLHDADEKIANPTAKGAKIIFSDNLGRKKTIYYFSTDVSEGGIRKSGFLTFCDKLGTGDSFVKSASYLMHSDNFSSIRDFLLTHSASVLEDDSGIPVRFFAQGWQLHTFGRYVGPIGLFAGQYQTKLADVFRKSTPTPLDFGVGYRWKPMESNLLLAVKDSSAVAFEIAPGNDRKANVKHRLIEASNDVPKKEPRAYRRRKDHMATDPASSLFGFSTP